MKTLLLDVVLWDLIIDAAGNIAVADNPYALAQDVASACRLYKGELFYNKQPGVPYKQILGKVPNLALLKANLEAAARTVPGVTKAKCVIAGVSGRTVTGQIQITDKIGQTQTVTF